jgi:hypothetical protein
MSMFRRREPVRTEEIPKDTALLSMKDHVDDMERRSIEAERRLAEFQASMGFK